MATALYAGVTEVDTLSPRVYAFQLTSSGTVQSNAFPVPLASRIVFSVVASSSACILQAPTGASEVRIFNQGANTLTVFPPVGFNFNASAVNASVTIAANSSLTFLSGDPGSPTIWTG